MKKKIVLCRCGNPLRLEWNAHCEGSYQYVDEEFCGQGEEDFFVDQGGVVNDNYTWEAVCDKCNLTYDDLEGLETKTIEIKA